MPEGGGAHQIGITAGRVLACPENEVLEQGTQFSGGCLDAICHLPSLGGRKGARLLISHGSAQPMSRGSPGGISTGSAGQAWTAPGTRRGKGQPARRIDSVIRSAAVTT